MEQRLFTGQRPFAGQRSSINIVFGIPVLAWQQPCMAGSLGPRPFGGAKAVSWAKVVYGAEVVHGAEAILRAKAILCSHFKFNFLTS